MIWNHPFFLITFLTGIIYVVMGMYMQKKPPKKINHYYGYRTKRSMKSQEHWDFAQIFSANSMVQWGSLLCLVSLIDFVIPMNELLAVILATSFTIIFALIPLYFTEREMKDRFD